MKNICVFCGSRPGTLPVYREEAIKLGQTLARQKRRLVFGGGRVGLMGALADASLAEGGEVIGVIPESLMAREVAHEKLHRLEVVSDMLSRKQRMIDLSDGFIILPGGLGTLDELFEVLTWQQLGLIDKPVCLLETGNFFRPLLNWLDNAVEHGFMDARHRDHMSRATTPEEALKKLDAGATA
ncbi:uncharacterized protein (TIGR00730 family) [Natronospira proteinivora]|uniref:Cytokinin riboside 5'-monophosphate phosphoribohydrolase n=1 Tax=Natronospira proteinivora TaxID=1807133 RepID=A0ABT1G4N7_9GAMM|nr:uncharacterized protein (TIGR00730 family) [Natronospira proteinivora]